ncbi:MFS transporter [Mycobacterium sp. Root265]|uniref:MFS transporter n=1 Tax=Mycobacterium sp. Root265 TaxID=1736504 RepID=UPI00070DD296|nr:MFS transporter [Mycobacterium sp. Root265]KRD07081.1 MFS transporter [Mycobacterium sp. Root265]
MSSTAVLGNPVFRRLFAAQIVALGGTGLLTVALSLLAYDLAGPTAGAVLGTVLAIKMLAYVFVAPIMATVTNRLPRRAVLIGADLTRATVALMLPFVGQIWQIFALVFVLQAASATFTPAFQAVIPAILTDERAYTRGLSLSRLAYDLEAMVSPILAAALLAVLTYNSLFVGTVAGFLLSAALVRRAAVPDIDPDRTPWRRRLLSGARNMLNHRELRALVAMNLAVAAATALVMVNTVVYVRDMLGGSEADVAMMLAAYGAGSMVVALSVPRLLTVVTDRTVMLSGAGVAASGLLVAATVLVAATPTWPVLASTWALLGAATSMVNTPAGRLLRRASTETNRTALFTAQFSMSHAGFLLTYPIAGWVGAAVNQGLAAAILAILGSFAALAAAWIMTRGRGEADGRDIARETPSRAVAESRP